jgi:hypothetical protein
VLDNRLAVAKPPHLSAQDRVNARAKAVAARRVRARISSQLAAGQLTVPAVMIQARHDEAIARMKVRDVFESLAGVGPQKATQLMAKFKISEAKRIGGLGPRQRVEVIKHFS